MRELSASERAHVYTLPVWWPAPGEENEMLPIGKKLRPAMAPLAGHEARHGHRRTTVGHQAHYDPTDDVRREYQDAVAVPRTTAATRRVREYLRGAASQIDPFQLAVGKKANRAAIR